ncbi:hypothetical protein [Streptomyces sp. ST2-7A]|uniref:DUF7848 domain-containing protein n=1 Tax=Streptomyces sp. ST2-7A TaxID=2907214 RepID=UPI001F415571|nr:hypothetical protein [Streptomyces sp. ST2-7A]MCE7081360.1 hypothetical protein [Streptomyces sp. ST2-7A]
MSYRYGRTLLSSTCGPVIFRAQCERCAEMGPRAETGEAAMVWVVIHRRQEPDHEVFRELRSLPYRVEV